MDIFFKTKKLKRICNSDEKAKKAFGIQRAKLIRRRLDDLAAAESLDVMRTLGGRFHPLSGDRAGQFSLDLDGPYRLIFEAASENPSEDPISMSWSEVTAVRILGVEDTHG